MTQVAVGLAGRIGSGKTTLASELANRIGCPRAAFGDFVRSVAEMRGLDAEDRTVLQDLGDELISQGWSGFVGAILHQASYTSGPLVIDGIRHRLAIDTLRARLHPTRLIVVAVDASDERRRERLQDRGLDSDGMRSADAHTNESEVDAVIRAADVILPADLTVDEACTTVLTWVSHNID